MILFEIEPNDFLNQEIQAFYHTAFFGYRKPNNPDYLNILKNDNHQNWSNYQLNNAATILRNILIADLPQILESLELTTLTVCIVPRSKADNTYRPDQLLFKSTIQAAINQLAGFVDGANYISRHTNTKTTHLRRPIEGYINDGQAPYQGITADTCDISNNVEGKNILLIDDIYTRTVNIDEDVIQTLLNNRAASVAFYAIGQTVGD
jgi:hypothetical protein